MEKPNISYLSVGFLYGQPVPPETMSPVRCMGLSNTKKNPLELLSVASGGEERSQHLNVFKSLCHKQPCLSIHKHFENNFPETIVERQIAAFVSNTT